MVVLREDKHCQVPSQRASKLKQKISFAFASMVVLLKDRKCQVPSQRAIKLKILFLAFASMVVLLKDKQCQVPSPRASKLKKNFFCLSIPWWSYSKIDNVKSLHQGQVNEKNCFCFCTYGGPTQR